MKQTIALGLVGFLTAGSALATNGDYSQDFVCQSNLNGTVFEATWFMDRSKKNAPKDAIHAKYNSRVDFISFDFRGERSLNTDKGVAIGFRMGTENSYELTVNEKKNPELFKRIGGSSYCTAEGDIRYNGPAIR